MLALFTEPEPHISIPTLSTRLPPRAESRSAIEARVMDKAGPPGTTTTSPLLANLESAGSSPVGPRPRIGPELRFWQERGCDAAAGSEVANVLADRGTVAASKRSGALAFIDRAGARSSPRISSQLDDERRCVAGFCLAILNGVGGGAGAPWRSRRRRAGQSSSPVLACIIGALRPWMAPMISSDEIPSR